MDRRHFIAGASAKALALAAAPALAVGQKQDSTDYDVNDACQTAITRLGGMPISEMRDFHMKDLREGYLPGWYKTVRVDMEYGGFMPYLDKDGKPRSTNKQMYYQGRGIWMCAYVYNHIDKDPFWLEAALKGRDFVFEHCRDERGWWLSEVTREGEPVEPSVNIYGDIYVAMGLGELYVATGEERNKTVAIETVHTVTDRIVSAEYQHLGGHGAGHEPGTKRLGTWQHFLAALTPLARQTDDYGVKMIARMCVRNILERHWRPELGVALEHLDDQFEPFRPDPKYNHRIVSGWHSIQAAWMCMDEALRLGHRDVFMDALEMGRRTLEKCWYDDGAEAGLTGLSNPEAKPGLPSSGHTAWGALDDAMVFTLLAIEHTHAPWAVEWYDRIFATSYAHIGRMIREGLLHHPRRLFMAPEIIDRMVQRGGRTSDFLKVG